MTDNRIKNRPGFAPVTRNVRLASGGTGKATRWMRTVPPASAATGLAAGPGPALVGAGACLSQTDARMHNWNASALNRHGLALTETQLDAIKAGIQDSPAGFVEAWLTTSSGDPRAHQSVGSAYEGAVESAFVTFYGDEGELFSPMSIAEDRLRNPPGGDEDDVNDFADHLADLRAYGLESETLGIFWESIGGDNGREESGHFCNIRLAE